MCWLNIKYFEMDPVSTFFLGPSNSLWHWQTLGKVRTPYGLLFFQVVATHSSVGFSVSNILMCRIRFSARSCPSSSTGSSLRTCSSGSRLAGPHGAARPLSRARSSGCRRLLPSVDSWTLNGMHCIRTFCLSCNRSINGFRIGFKRHSQCYTVAA